MRTRTGVLAVLLACLAAGEDLPAGHVIDRVECRDNPRQSYALYLPSAYTPRKAWPVIYCLDPGAQGRLPVGRFAAAAEKYGFILAGSNNSRNSAPGESAEALQWLPVDLAARVSLDPKRIYAAGFSGGARLALGWAQAAGLAGVVACGAGTGTSVVPKQVPFQIFAVAGKEDFNYYEVHAMGLTLARRGWPVRFAEFEGAHQWLPEALADDALAFFAGALPPQPPEESREVKKRADLFLRLTAELAQADPDIQKSMIAGLHKDASRPEESARRTVARQVLGWAFVRSMEESRRLMQEKQIDQAAAMAEMGVLARPDSAGAWWNVAEIQAAAGQKKRAREALQRALDAGFSDAARVEQLRARIGR